jgi:hypothetical protein
VAPETGFRKHIDPWSMVIIGITLVLFVVALLVKGLTSAMLLEAGVFLVSVKLIIATYKSSQQSERIMAELKALRQTVEGRGTNAAEGDRDA